MTELIIVGVVAVLVITALVVGLALVLKDWREDRKDLLNRIMARDYREFAENEPQAKESKSMKVVALDDLRRELYEGGGEPLGMPV